MLDYHLQRLKNSADYFLFKFDEDKIETELKNITANFNRNENDELLEGAISNLVIEKNGKLFTPAIELGILNGCYRKYLLKKAKCEEKLLILNDLVNADKIILCNSVRKEVIVDEVYDQTEISILNP